MRIAIISYEFPPDSSFGGIATYVWEAANLLSTLGHEIEIFASSASRNETIESEGFIVHWIKEPNAFDFGIIAGHKFSEIHQKRPFEILEAADYNADARKAIELHPEVPFLVKLHTPNRIVIELGWQVNSRITINKLIQFFRRTFSILIGNSIEPFHLYAKQLYFAIDQIECAQAAKANRVVSPSLDLLKFAGKEWNISQEKMVHCPYVFEPTEKLLSIQPRIEGKVIGFFGRLEYRKGIETLVEAIPEVLKKHPDAKFHFIGNSQYRSTGEYYRDWIENRLENHKQSIKFIGSVPNKEMHHYYEQVNICVFPSIWENFPFVCLEAMASAKAIIGSKAGGMSEMLTNENFGLLTEPNKPGMLAKHIIYLLDNPKERLEMGKAARKRVLEEYNREIIGKQMVDIYLSAIKDKK